MHRAPHAPSTTAPPTGPPGSPSSRPTGGNPVTVAMAAELLQAVRQARREDAHVIVLQAVGRAFCVGGDVRGSG